MTIKMAYKLVKIRLGKGQNFNGDITRYICWRGLTGSNFLNMELAMFS